MFRTLYRTAKGTARVRKQTSTQETADSDQYDIRKSVLQGDVLSPWLFCLLMCYVLKIADEGRRDIAHPAEMQTGEETKECAACETQYLRSDLDAPTAVVWCKFCDSGLSAACLHAELIDLGDNQVDHAC